MEDEAILFRRMQKGDWAAFTFFFRTYTERLYLYALAFVKERAVAEDVVQDAFIYLWTNRARIEYKGAIYAYLLQSVRNACINYRTHLEVEEKYREVIKRVEEGDETETEWEEIRQKVMSVVNDLPPKCREIFVLGVVEGLKYHEIAERLDISVNTVKTQMKYAYRKVRNQIKLDEFLGFILLGGDFFS